MQHSTVYPLQPNFIKVSSDLIWSNQGDLAYTLWLSTGHKISFTDRLCASPVHCRAGVSHNRSVPLPGHSVIQLQAMGARQVGNAGQHEVCCKVVELLVLCWWCGHGSPGDWSMSQAPPSPGETTCGQAESLAALWITEWWTERNIFTLVLSR